LTLPSMVAKKVGTCERKWSSLPQSLHEVQVVDGWINFFHCPNGGSGVFVQGPSILDRNKRSKYA
jgi:hypothetical protein